MPKEARNRKLLMRLAGHRIPRQGRLSKDGTIDTVASAAQHSSSQRLLAETETRVDISLLVSGLFLQRFSLTFAGKILGLEGLPFLFILLHQFFTGKLVIRYDRFLWFLGFGLAATCSLLLNFESTMLTGYSQFVVGSFLFALARPSTANQYEKTLQAFQLLVMLLSCLGVVQFVAQFVVDGTQLVRFYGLLDFLLDPSHDAASDPQGPRNFGGILKSNGMFLAEPSTFSQITALGILVEVLKFGRPRYLLVMALGFLVAFSGTGLMLLLLFLPLAGLRHSRAGLSALFIVILFLGIFATGMIDLSVFSSRVSEFQDTQSSGFVRFVAPFWLAAKRFDTGSLGELLMGSGPGTVNAFGDLSYAHAIVNWFKLFYEYGIIGSFIYYCFLASCLRRSRCPGLLIAVLIFNYLFEQGAFDLAIPLCTLNGPEPRRGRINETSRYGPFLAAGSASG
jgi:hypothetical protein